MSTTAQKFITSFRKEAKESAKKYAESMIKNQGNLDQATKSNLYAKFYKQGLAMHTRTVRKNLIDTGQYNPTVAMSSKGAVNYLKRQNLTSDSRTNKVGKDQYKKLVKEEKNFVKKQPPPTSNNTPKKDEDEGGGGNWWKYGAVGAVGLGGGYIASKMFSGNDEPPPEKYERFYKNKRG